MGERRIYKSALDDMFLEIAKLAEDGEGFRDGEIETHLDEIHKIRVKLLDNQGEK